MLEELAIQNYALVESLTVEFKEGLNILSGETGAGKSIIIGALGLLLGGKGDPSAIRTGCKEARVSGSINVVSNKEALSWLDTHDIQADNGYVLIRRILKSNGRSSLTIQSTPVTRGELGEFTSFLFDMHGQHAHQSLLNGENQRKLLDSFAGLSPKVEELKEEFLILSDLKKKLEELNKSEKDILLERDILEHAVKEIDEAGLRPGEEEELVKDRNLLVEHEKLMELFNNFSSTMSGETSNALAMLSLAGESLKSIALILEPVNEYIERWDNAFFEIEDVFESVKAYRENLDFSPARLEECEDRLQLIRRLKKKYGGSISAVLDFKGEAEKKLAGFDSREEDIDTVSREIGEREREVLEIAHAISRERKSKSSDLEKEIQKNLHKLGMEKASFSITVSPRESLSGKPSCGPTGMDIVQFLISANEGEPLKQLKTVASGGELSRIMLSIKTVFADSDSISTLVFDEIDAGIGGEVALAVGEHLSRLSGHKQILCITHLASIAVRADNHLKVEKIIEGHRTFTEVITVSGPDRVKEIARMLSGDVSNSASLDHARELLNKYQN